MISETIKHYKISDKIGEGGMGVVYKAYDSKLDREVALKFLPDFLSASEERKKRFLNEARAASALEHPNTCTIHEIDETPDGKLYIVMPLYKGKPLGRLIEEGPLSVEKALDIVIQIGEGLKAAHHKGVIHRDIKSGNILISDRDLAIIMDFGLAQKEQATHLTKTGETLGTVPYMSPEQAMGEDVDQRTDIWSMGVVLYEMLTGKIPFRSVYPQAIIYSILNEEPEELNDVRPDIPAELSRVLKQMLAKNREERYHKVDDLLIDLKQLHREITGYSTPSQRSKIKYIFDNWIFTPIPLVAITGLLIAVIGFIWMKPGEEIVFNEREWIMVTDFDNQTGEEVFDNLLGTILEVGLLQSSYVNISTRANILNVLRQDLQKKEVMSLTPDVVKEAALHENVKAILMPEISRTDNGYTVSAKIQNVKTGKTVPIEPVESVDKNQVLRAMDNLVKKVRLKLGEPASGISNGYTPIVRATTSSMEALKLYAEGLRIRGIDNDAGYNLIEQSVEIDPEFALAHAELGMHYYIEGNRQKGEEHYQKALKQIDRLTVRERLWIRAIVEDWRGNRDKAIENYKAYLSQYPDDYSGWWRLGYAYLITGNHEECIDAFSRVVEIESRDAGALVNIASCYNGLRENKLALENYERAFQIRPDFMKGEYVNYEYGLLLMRMGRLDEASETFELMLQEDETKARGVRSLALLDMYTGNYSTAIERFKEAILLNKSFGGKLSEYRDRLFLARSYKAKGMERECNNEMNSADKIINELTLSPYWLSMAGKIYARTGEIKKAKRLLDEISDRLGDHVAVSGVARNNPEDLSYYYLVKGEIALAEGNRKEAIESLEIAHNISDQLEPLAHGYYVLGNLDKAVETYRELIQTQNNGREDQQRWILAHYHLGKIYEERGDIQNAVKYYELFLEIWENGDNDLIALQDAKKRLHKLSELAG